MFVSSHTRKSVLYWIKMWCILSTPPRSTRHSAVEYPPEDTVHCPPDMDKYNLFPSTARSAPYCGNVGCWCWSHAGLFKATLSVKLILFRGGYIPLMQFLLSVMLTLGSKAPTLIFAQQRVTPWIKAHQMASLMLKFCCVKSISFSGKCVCIENYF